MEDKYQKLIKTVFGNDKGDELLAAWQEMYGDRPSYMEGMSRDEMLVREGERRFFLIIKSLRTENDRSR